MGGASGTYEGSGVNKALVGKTEEKRTLGRPRHRWEDNIKMELQDVGKGLWGLDVVVLRVGTGGGLL
jgi:hypothetical protein